MNPVFENKKKCIVEKLTEKGLRKDESEVIADVMTTADYYGVTSHGISVLDSHLMRIESGRYNLRPSFQCIRETASFAVINGDNAIGFLAANYCMSYAVKRAKEVGVFTVFSRNNNTFGPAFYYPLKASEQGMIGFVCCNSPAQMAPVGGKEKLLGTNPFAAVFPVPGENPIIIDMATSVVAKSKFKEYKEQGKLLPDGWALDSEGNPTNDPDEGIKGLVLPMAGYKGYAISMLVDLVSGLLSGSAFLNRVGRFYSNDEKCMNVGQLFVAIDPEMVLGDVYGDSIKEYISCVRNSEKHNDQKISIPGDRKHAFRDKNEEN